MSSRTVVAKLQATAREVRELHIDTAAKIKLVRALCALLKECDSRFDPDRFSQACFGEDW